MNTLLPIVPIVLSLFLLLPVLVAQDAQDVTTTVIDLLSENVEFSYFLRLLQRNQLIPYLNQLEGITLAAPVNSALVGDLCVQIKGPEKRGSDGGGDASDCLDSILDDFGIASLNKYIINEPVHFSQFEGYKIVQSVDGLPILIQSGDSFEINHRNVVEVDLFASSQDSYVQGIDQTYELGSSRDLIESVGASVFGKLLDDTDVGNKTVLLPLDSSFEFSDYELDYLYSEYGIKDKDLIIGSLLIDGYHGGYISETVEDNNGYEVDLKSEDKGGVIVINDTASIDSNRLSEDAVFHIFDSHKLIQSVEFNPMKTLIGLDASSFVDELLLQGLGHLIQDNELNQTIFISKDSSQFTQITDSTRPNHSKDEFEIQSKSSNLYHFINERIDDLSHSYPLYDSKFCNSKKLGSSCQKIKISPISEDTYIINNNVLIEDGPYTVGNTAIYLTDDHIRTPNDVISSINPVFHCFKSINYLSQLKLHKLPNNNQGYTLFLPCFESFKDFEMTFDYLERNTTALEIIMKNLILEGLVYSDTVETQLELKNLNGDVVKLEINNDDKHLSIGYDGDDITLQKNDDILFNQGVIQPIHEFIIPSQIEITLRNIIQSSDSEAFLELISQFLALNQLLDSSDYSILLPSSYSLSRLPAFTNATLEQFLNLHIIPSSTPLYDCTSSIQTLNPKVNLTCSRISSSTSLQIQNGSEQSVRILSKGCISHSKHVCVYSIDKPIDPNWIQDHYHISLPGIALGVGMLLGSVSMITFLLCVMLIVLKRRGIKGSGSDTEAGGGADENTPLVNETNGYGNGNANGNSGNGGGEYGGSFESGYSDNAQVDPISLKKKRVSFVDISTLT